MKIGKGQCALAAGVFATMLWGSQAVVAVHAAPALNFLGLTLLLHVFALAGATALNLFRPRDFVRDVKFIFSVPSALGFWLLSGVCQAVCFLLFYLAVQNGPQVPGMIMHFMWPFVFAVSNALFPSTWKERSSGYELTVVALGLVGLWFLITGGKAAGEHSALFALGKTPLMLAGLASAVFGCFNAVCDYHALARARARRLALLQKPDLPVSFRYSALQFRFLAGLVTTLVLWAAQSHVPLLPAVDFSGVSWLYLLAPLWLGLAVYFGAEFFFSYTMTHVSESARQGFTYLPPLFGAVFLCLGGAQIGPLTVFGILIILLSMFQMQAGTRVWTANTAAPLLFIFSSIIVLCVPDLLQQHGLLGKDGTASGVGAEVMAGVFAIVISFLLSRLLDRNKAENELQIENASIMGEILDAAEKSRLDADARAHIRELLYGLGVHILDFDVNTDERRRAFLIRKINIVARGFARGVETAWPSGPPEAIKTRLDEIERNVQKWIYRRSQFLSLAEKWSVVLLSFSSIVAFLIATNRSPDWYADMSAIALITTVFILVFQTFDLGADRSKTEVADLLNKQMPLLRHGFLPYVPYELIEKRAYVSEGKPATVLTRPPEGIFVRLNLPPRERDLKLLEMFLNTAGLVTVIVLLLHKHGLL